MSNKYPNINFETEDIETLYEVIHSFTLFFVILFIVCCIALIAVVITLIRFSITKQHKKESDEYVTHVINAQEEERSRISAELHDTVAQDLRAAVSLAQNDELKAILRTCITEIRSMCYKLVPPDLSRQNLSAAIQSLCLTFKEKTDLDISLAILDECENILDSNKFSDSKKLAVYRIIQESLTNIQKHAKASEVSIIIRIEQKGEIGIFIEDDGKGFMQNSLTQKFKQSHFGLQGMKQRSVFLGAKLTITSEKGLGTQVKLIVPYQE